MALYELMTEERQTERARNRVRVNEEKKHPNRKSCVHRNTHTHSYKLVWHQEIIIIHTRQMKNHFGFKKQHFIWKTLWERAREKRQTSFKYVQNAFWRVHHVAGCHKLCVALFHLWRVKKKAERIIVISLNLIRSAQIFLFCSLIHARLIVTMALFWLLCQGLCHKCDLDADTVLLNTHVPFMSYLMQTTKFFFFFCSRLFSLSRLTATL